MPNRIIKDSICTSERLALATDFQFRLWVSLLVYVDDYGRGDARPAIIKGACFPLRERLSVKDIENALLGLADIGCVDLYKVDGKPYLCLPRWDKHQRIQTKRSKYPAPPEKSESTVSHGESPLESNPIQYESNTNPNPSISVAPVIFIPLVGDSSYGVSQDQVDEWAQLYPGVDIMQELRNMVGWSKANPSKRKTKRGVLRFITGWLEREQNSGRKRPQKGDGSVWQGLETL